MNVESALHLGNCIIFARKQIILDHNVLPRKNTDIPIKFVHTLTVSPPMPLLRNQEEEINVCLSIDDLWVAHVDDKSTIEKMIC